MDQISIHVLSSGFLRPTIFLLLILLYFKHTVYFAVVDLSVYTWPDS